jgi:hypothetical protein
LVEARLAQDWERAGAHSLHVRLDAVHGERAQRLRVVPSDEADRVRADLVDVLGGARDDRIGRDDSVVAEHLNLRSSARSSISSGDDCATMSAATLAGAAIAIASGTAATKSRRFTTPS